MVTFAVSDLHLSDDERPAAFTEAKEKVFVALAAELHLRGGELVLAGDVFDLTSMSAPAMGLGDFFRDALPRELGAGLRASVPARSAALRLESIHRRYPAFFEALRPIANAGRLTILPGNHDCELGVASARAALSTEIGGVGERIRFAPTYRASEFALIVHGHPLDASNATDRGCQNRGAVITQAIESGLGPALGALGVPPDVVHAAIAVRPEENVVGALARWIGAERASKLLRAFVDLLRKNRYFEGLGDVAEGWLAKHPKGEGVRADDVLEILADDSDLKARTRKSALRVLEGKSLAPDGRPPPRILATGHTHELDASSRYVNLGSWVDHVRGLSPSDLIRVDRTLPVLSVDGETAVLRDASALPLAGRLDLCPRLWVYRG